jgi:hypothetical protein
MKIEPKETARLREPMFAVVLAHSFSPGGCCRGDFFKPDFFDLSRESRVSALSGVSGEEKWTRT